MGGINSDDAILFTGQISHIIGSLYNIKKHSASIYHRINTIKEHQVSLRRILTELAARHVSPSQQVIVNYCKLSFDFSSKNSITTSDNNIDNNYFQKLVADHLHLI